nr:flagellar basal body rod protein FlgB [Paenibacillus bovis]
MNLFSNNISLLEKGLDYSALKNKTIAQNIANVDVPNYKKKTVSFKEVLADSTKHIDTYRSDPRHFPISLKNSSPTIQTSTNWQYHHNGNNVDIDKEMSDLATNQIYYQALVERINGKFSTLQNVIKGGR